MGVYFVCVYVVMHTYACMILFLYCLKNHFQKISVVETLPSTVDSVGNLITSDEYFAMRAFAWGEVPVYNELLPQYTECLRTRLPLSDSCKVSLRLHTFLYWSIHLYVYTSICVYVSMCVCVCIYVCVCVFMCVCGCLWVCVYILLVYCLYRVRVLMHHCMG